MGENVAEQEIVWVRDLMVIKVGCEFHGWGSISSI